MVIIIKNNFVGTFLGTGLQWRWFRCTWPWPLPVWPVQMQTLWVACQVPWYGEPSWPTGSPTPILLRIFFLVSVIAAVQGIHRASFQWLPPSLWSAFSFEQESLSRLSCSCNSQGQVTVLVPYPHWGKTETIVSQCSLKKGRDDIFQLTTFRLWYASNLAKSKIIICNSQDPWNYVNKCSQISYEAFQMYASVSMGPGYRGQGWWEWETQPKQRALMVSGQEYLSSEAIPWKFNADENGRCCSIYCC